MFVRTTRQVRLTEAGRVLLDRARIVLDAAREAREAVARVAGLEQGVLHLGATPSLPGFIDLPSLLALFHERYPAIEVHLSQGNARQLLDRLLKDGVTDQEVADAKHRLEISAIKARDSVSGPTFIVAEALGKGRKLADLQAWPDRIEAVTQADVMKAARQILRPENSVTGTLLPKAPQGASQ